VQWLISPNPKSTLTLLTNENSDLRLFGLLNCPKLYKK